MQCRFTENEVPPDFLVKQRQEEQLFASLKVETPVLINEMSWQNFCTRKCAYRFQNCWQTNKHTNGHRPLCAKMADAWANQLITSHCARDENALLRFYRLYLR